jgi:hypothetical protein
MADSKPATTKSKGGRPKKGEAPEFDFGSLEFREAELPKPADDNPFSKPLGESYEYDTARAVVIPTAGVTRASGLIRRAADKLEIGVSIVENPAKDEKGNALPNMTELVFKGKPRRQRKRKGENGEQTDAPVAGSSPATEDTGTAATEPAQSGQDATTGAETDAGKVSEPAAS